MIYQRVKSCRTAFKYMVTSLNTPFHKNSNRTMVSVPKLQDYFIWIDLEMTGLNAEIHKIIEVACIITTPNLEEVCMGFHKVIHQPKHVFENECSEWSRNQHEKSGLMEESLRSKVSVDEADDELSKYIQQNSNYKSFTGKYILAGNSVYMDKLFIKKYMPKVDKLLHYRLLDVSSLKVIFSNWYQEAFNQLPPKKGEHRALGDIKESINELKLYREKFFVPLPN